MAKFEVDEETFNALASLGAKLAREEGAPSEESKKEAKRIKRQLKPRMGGPRLKGCSACATCAICFLDGPIPDLEGVGILGLLGLF